MSKIHIVRQGENIYSIARQYNCDADSLWRDGSNAQLRRIRRCKASLLPGDQICISEQPATFTVSTGQIHYFVVTWKKVHFRLQLTKLGQPRSNEAYIWRADGEEEIGHTDSEGWIEKTIDPKLRCAELEMVNGEEKYLLDLCHLDPVESTSGRQMRLANMGFYFGAIDGEWGERSKAASQAFIRSMGQGSTEYTEDEIAGLLFNSYDM